ncbi:uncharacterized protein K02A2.6-like [Corticium candelabrum]|uniref:uncharacterized protein K02A2.6-like n=1 Tax=Corticium candelabrum TaxID=121492 RepID=UPI002E256012|nr:uncharacterized protein K02A2.6-like [Corticium candelabrum]
MFELDGIPYLLSVDYYSKWITVTKLDYTRSLDIIKAVDKQFANFGVPEEVISDNGPQFACPDFRRLTDTVGFRHVTSSPEYPSSNDQAEQSIQTAKKTIGKMFADGRSLPDVLHGSTENHPNLIRATITSRAAAKQTITHPIRCQQKDTRASCTATARNQRQAGKATGATCFSQQIQDSSTH